MNHLRRRIYETLSPAPRKNRTFQVTPSTTQHVCARGGRGWRQRAGFDATRRGEDRLHAGKNTGERQTMPIDLNHDGIPDFFLYQYFLDTDTTVGSALVGCLNLVVSNGTWCGSSSGGTNALNGFRTVQSGTYVWEAAVKPGAKNSRW